jgi:hypothetical protein
LVKLNEAVYFSVTTRGTSGLVDADSAPTFDIYEQATDTPVASGTMTKRTGYTGVYRGTFTPTTVGGYTVGRYYDVVVSGTVSSITDKAVALTFVLRSASIDDVSTATTASAIRTAVGLASANLDTQLTAIDDYIDTEVAAIKAKTDNLPASPAATGDAMTLTSGERTNIAAAVWNALTSGLTTANSIGKRLVDFVTTLVYSTPPTAAANATAVRTELTTELDRIDVATSTRLASASYTTPPTAVAIAAQVTTDHGSGSYIRNTEPPTVVEIDTQLSGTHGSDVWTGGGDSETVTGMLSTIIAQTASSTISPILPLGTESEPLSVIRTNTYSETTLQPISFTITDIGTPDSVQFIVSVAGTGKFAIDAVVTDLGNDTLRISVPELTGDQIEELPSGALSDYQFLATYTDELRTIRFGKMHVTDVAVAP